MSCGVSCQIVSSCWAKWSTFRNGCNLFPITSQMCSIAERSGWPRNCRVSLRPGIAVLKSNPGCRKRNSNRTSRRMSLTYPRPVSMTEITTKGVRLSKEMAPQTMTPCCGVVWHALVRAGSPRCLGRLQIRLRMSAGHIWKRDSSLKTLRPQSAQFRVDRAPYHCNWT